MCCFSPVSAPVGFFARLLFGLSGTPALHVSGTRIFARVEGQVQHLVYAMRVSMKGEVAMILPVPVVPGSGDSALEFVSLSGYPNFFDHLERHFRGDMIPLQAKGGLLSRGAPPLVVHRVGSFDASYVPSRADFSRLDPRFRIDDRVWDGLPEYRDWGFAVFKLRHGGDVHPMAFRFPTRDPSRVFFPTVHVHDGQLVESAAFDHDLYWQGAAASSTDRLGPAASELLSVALTQGLVDGAARVALREMRGLHPNRDVWIGREPPEALAA